jgi:hypothetical protein
MQGRVQLGGQRTAERFAPVADQARMMANDRVEDARFWAADRVMDARGWTAPRIVRAARYVQEDLGPRVSEMLIATARRVEPPRRRRSRQMMMGFVIVGGLAGAMAAMMAARRSAERIAIDRIDEEAAGDPARAGSQASVNGQVDIP